MNVKDKCTYLFNFFHQELLDYISWHKILYMDWIFIWQEACNVTQGNDRSQIGIGFRPIQIAFYDIQDVEKNIFLQNNLNQCISLVFVTYTFSRKCTISVFYLCIGCIHMQTFHCLFCLFWCASFDEVLAYSNKLLHQHRLSSSQWC